jgi:hypothetical protein
MILIFGKPVFNNVVVYRLAGKASFLGPDSRCVLRNARVASALVPNFHHLPLVFIGTRTHSGEFDM